MEAAVAHLLDFSKPFDHSLLDSLAALAMDGKHDNATRAKADKVLVLLQEHPDMWKRADTIIESSTSLYSKIFACNVLVEAISVRWRVIPPEQREGIKTYILGKIVYYSSTPALAKDNHLLLSKLNFTLVSILKQDWPQNWPTFIHELVMSAQTSESLCENSMYILRLLSEEIFEYSKDALTSVKARQLKESLTEEFSKVFQLCEAVLSSTTSVSLTKSTLGTLQRFLTWIPLGYIFETSLIPLLITNFLPTATYRYVLLDMYNDIYSLSHNHMDIYLYLYFTYHLHYAVIAIIYFLFIYLFCSYRSYLLLLNIHIETKLSCVWLR